MPAAAYPYHAWPRVTREEASFVRGALRGLAQHAPSALREAERLLGTRLRCDALAAELLRAESARAELRGPFFGLTLEWSASARTFPAVCELPPALGARLVDRLLGGDGDVAQPIGRGLDALSQGALGYLGARLCAAADGALRVRELLTAPERTAELLGDARTLVWPIRIELGGVHAGTLRFFIPEATARAVASRPPLSAPAPRALQHLPLVLCAHAGRAILRKRELLALGPGDVVVPERCRLERGASGFEGELELHVSGSARVCGVCRVRNAQLVIQSFSAGGEIAMTEGKRIETEAIAENTNAAALAADAPISLCLELARFTLSLGELSQLRPGEVLRTTRAIGERAVLSAAGQPVAIGELCDVEGEIGLRVLELVPSQSTMR